LLRDVAVRNVKAFEEHFLSALEAKNPEILAEFKKGNLPEDGLKKMTELAQSLVPQYK
jgi:F-type H+-transporting ATPase subunit alpha